MEDIKAVIRSHPDAERCGCNGIGSAAEDKAVRRPVGSRIAHTGIGGGREEELGGIYRNGSLVNFRWVTQEEAELLYSLLECARPETNSEQTILEIMKEEAACLFGGSKTAEAVAKNSEYSFLGSCE